MTHKLIAFYGINAIGKSTQVAETVDWLSAEIGRPVRSLKYPIYDLEPTGPIINKYLRDPAFRAANPMSVHQLQELYATNRRDYQELLRELLQHTHVIVEDYVVTGIAWGLAEGGDKEYLESINQDLLRPDVELLMDGNQFEAALEENHHNESSPERITKCKSILQKMAVSESWPVINANQEIEKVQSDIRQALRSELNL